MKKIILINLFILAVLVVSYGQPDLQKDGLYVENLCKKKFGWMVHGQLDSLEMILDNRIKFVHSNGWIQNKKEVIEDLKSGKLSFQSIEATELEVRVYDKTAIVNGKGKFTGALGGTAFSVSLMFTEVYVLNTKGWQLASRHANKLL